MERRLDIFKNELLQFMKLVESENVGAMIQIRDGRVKTKLWIEEECHL